MKDNNLELLKKEYLETKIPAELDDTVNKYLKEGKKMINKKKYIKRISTITASAAAVTIILTIGVNSNKAFAKTMSEIPIVGSIIKVLTFNEYKIDEDTYHADIETPAIEGLENKDLESSLNEKYYDENKELYDKFMLEMKDLEVNGGGHMGIDSGYVVKTDTENILSLGRYVVNTVGSSSTTFKYDTIDKKTEVLITLPSLFKDENYIEIISENIKKQMVEQHENDENKIYWVKGLEELITPFEKISKNQDFYINQEGKLIISFDKYEVAPGYMGVVEFEIPTEILLDVLIGIGYIK